jgi:hypothetical protein
MRLDHPRRLIGLPDTPIPHQPRSRAQTPSFASRSHRLSSLTTPLRYTITLHPIMDTSHVFFSALMTLFSQHHQIQFTHDGVFSPNHRLPARHSPRPHGAISGTPRPVRLVTLHRVSTEFGHGNTHNINYCVASHFLRGLTIHSFMLQSYCTIVLHHHLGEKKIVSRQTKMKS